MLRVSKSESRNLDYDVGPTPIGIWVGNSRGGPTNSSRGGGLWSKCAGIFIY